MHVKNTHISYLNPLYFSYSSRAFLRVTSVETKSPENFFFLKKGTSAPNCFACFAILMSSVETNMSSQTALLMLI